jgi:hypothetical protein
MSAVLTISGQDTLYDEHAADGYWGRTVAQRLHDTASLAARLGRLALPPYIPRYKRLELARGWETQLLGYLRATPLRAVRHWVGEYPRERAECVAWRVLALVAQVKLEHPTIRWADLGRLAAWPVAYRLDAKRLRERLGPLTTATWCIACDDAPWASSTRLCLWCERQGAPPRAMRLVERAA